MSFFQEPPVLASAFDDPTLRAFLRQAVPPDVERAITPSLSAMGAKAAGPLADLSRRHRLDEPRHVPFDPWGNRVDRVEVNEAWKEMARVAAEDGLVGVAYERRHGAYSRVHQFLLVHLFAPSSQTYSCPLAMTDGCARTLELVAPPALRDRVLPRLVGRDPATAWTSGQWMTERTGGSDVGLSETVARRADGDVYRLHGTKWFTSAVTSDVALTLARPEGNGPGGKGLALFYLRVRGDDGRLNGLTVHRLKDKLGTRHLPTAELLLDGAVAEPVAGLTDGIRNMSSMLNITRTWNAVCAVAGMQRGLALARDYARRRIAFGTPLSEKPLHLETLAELSADYDAAFGLAFHQALLLGKSETGEASANEQAVLQVLTPLTKLFTGKLAVASASEVLECFGGAGYVEDTGLPALLRDAQVLSIWEGTTNVLALETIRALAREDAWDPLIELVRRARVVAREPSLAALAHTAETDVVRAIAWAREAAGTSRPLIEAGARRFALVLAKSVALSLLVVRAESSLDDEHDRRGVFAARRFGARRDELPLAYQPESTRAFALGEPML
ncbi:MAG TPA: acyl-CoA dehydrogenase family protein [Polyangiaceae bacterium]|jgi:alkylation response protein AidB-like acyl-CoA dehydrogenase|nr:acyl-CoA dehydrogenase family protein [Polyangiaceae bacterium]